jgi:hypothetical protein
MLTVNRWHPWRISPFRNCIISNSFPYASVMTTPEERARADEITASVGRFVRQSQAVRIEGVSPEQPKNPDRWLRVGVIFVLVLALHVAAFVGYRHYQDKQDGIKDQQRAELEAMRTDAAIAQAQARQLRERSQPHRHHSGSTSGPISRTPSNPLITTSTKSRDRLHDLPTLRRQNQRHHRSQTALQNTRLPQ